MEKVPKHLLHAVPRDSQLISMVVGLYFVVNLTPKATNYSMKLGKCYS
jgi:hypothetical protein